MTINKKVLLVLISTFFLLILIAGVCIYFISIKAFLDLEKREIEAHTIRARNSLMESVGSLESTVGDWAWWTDTYEFVKGNYRDYLHDHLDAHTLATLKLDFMWFSSIDGREYTGIMVDAQAEQIIPFSLNLRNYFETAIDFNKDPRPEAISGLIKLPEGLMAVAITPVLKNDLQGPYVGTMVIGRYITKSTIEDLSTRLKISLSINTLDELDSGNGFSKIKEQISTGESLISYPLNYNQVIGAVLINDINSQPISILSIVIERTLYQQGMKTLILMEYVQVLIAVIVLIVVFVLLNKFWLFRLNRIGNQITEIDIESSGFNPIKDNGRDEIYRIVQAFNALMAKVYHSRNRLKMAQEELEDRVLERTMELKETNTKLSMEIHERISIQEELIESLKVKEVLLKEVYHRTKNNMSAIASLMNLQSSYARDESSKEVLCEMESRVYSMMLVNEKLYNSDDFINIDLDEYFRDLSKSIVSNYRLGSAIINLKFETETVTVSTESAIPCGLILNELITNAMKYAYPKGNDGDLIIFLYPEGRESIVFGVKDFGFGLPEAFDFETTDSLGLALVRMLAEGQLNGSVEYTSVDGMEWKIRFPVKSE